MKLPCKIKVKDSDIVFDVYEESRGSKFAVLEWYNDREEFRNSTYKIEEVESYIKNGDWFIVE